MIAFTGAEATRVPDRSYFDFILASAESTRRRLWASLFIFDVRPPRDLAGQVLELVHALVERRRVGVDVRVLLTGAVSTPDIAVANLATGLLLDGYGVPQRRVFEDAGSERSGSHAKFVIWDDHALVGSQNWTDDAFRLNLEDSLVLAGPPVEQLAGEFLRLWALGRGVPRDAAG